MYCNKIMQNFNFKTLTSSSYKSISQF